MDINLNFARKWQEEMCYSVSMRADFKIFFKFFFLLPHNKRSSRRTWELDLAITAGLIPGPSSSSLPLLPKQQRTIWETQVLIDDRSDFRHGCETMSLSLHVSLSNK